MRDFALFSWSRSFYSGGRTISQDPDTNAIIYLLAGIATILLIALMFIFAACGGTSPQDAEAHVIETMEAEKGVNVQTVFCEETDGDRYLCDVKWNLPGYGRGDTDQVIVDKSDL